MKRFFVGLLVSLSLSLVSLAQNFVATEATDKFTLDDVEPLPPLPPSPPPTGTLFAFPWAYGPASLTAGGRGMPVMLVTNANDSGTGSARACLQTNNINCVPTVAGTNFVLSTILTGNNVTWYGQAAPGGGFQFTNGPSLNADLIRTCAHDVILEDFRVRGGMPYVTSGQFAINVSVGNSCSVDVYNIIVDHISTAYALWDNMGAWSTSHSLKNISFGWNILAEPTFRVNRSSGINVGSGSSSANADLQTGIFFYRNWNHSSGHRNPIIRSAQSVVCGNLTYNANYYEAKAAGQTDFCDNYFKNGPYGPSLTHEIQTWTTNDASTNDGTPNLYIDGNAGFSNNGDPTANQWAGTLTGVATGACVSENSCSDNSDSISAPIPTTYQRTTPLTYAGQALPRISAKTLIDPSGPVLAPLGVGGVPGGGASFKLNDTACTGGFVANRDSLDSRYQTEVLSGSATLGTAGISTDLQDPGTLPTLATKTACAMTFSLGLADAWVVANGLPTNDPNLNVKTAPNGYTYLECYMWGMSPGGVAARPTAPTNLAITVN